MIFIIHCDLNIILTLHPTNLVSDGHKSYRVDRGRVYLQCSVACISIEMCLSVNFKNLFLTGNSEVTVCCMGVQLSCVASLLLLDREEKGLVNAV